MANKSGKVMNKGLGTMQPSKRGRSQKMDTEKKSGKWSSKKILQAPMFQWLKQEKWTIFMLIGLFALALFLRAYFFYDTAFTTWPPQVAGNDPDYHKWCIDYFQTYHRHLRLDPMLNYPLAGGNPRPPVYDWSIAILGLILGPLFGGTEKVTWYIFEFNHCVWGALTVIPIFFIGREIFGKKEGLLAGLLFALSSAHIERSSLGFSDHDAIIVFFITTGFYFLLKGMSLLEDKNYIKNWLRPGDIILGLRDLFRDTKISLGYFLMAGVSIGTVCLTWQGFGYIFAIIFIYFFVQILLNKFRKVDSLPFFLGIFIILGIPMLMCLPYYYLFFINAWMTPLFIFIGIVVLGVLFVPTRDLPWILVIPSVAALLGAAYGILGLVSPETKDLLFSGGGYFIKSKLYSTIAEAQAPEISRLIMSIGPATFFCALVGIVWAAILIPKRLKKDFLFNTTWATVAIFMAISAVRFEFNATPIFCIMGAWIIMKAVNKFNPSGISSVVLSLVGCGIVVGLLVLNYLRIDDSTSDYYFKLDEYSFFDWIGMHSSTTAYLRLTILFVVLIFTFGLFIFLKYVLKKEKYTLSSMTIAIFVGFLVVAPGFLLALDAAIPYEKKQIIDQDYKYMGASGSSFNSEYWNAGLEWLSEQDSNTSYYEKPAWISWWDYGFWAINVGRHPTVADNFQNGYQLAGSFIAAQNESEAVSLLTARLLEGDWVRNARENGKVGFTPEVKDLLIKALDGGNTQYHPHYDKIYDIYSDPGKYREIVMDNQEKYGHYLDITDANAKYATTRVELQFLGKENMVNLLHDVEAQTKTSIQYFGVDSRLFPFNAKNTGIFYAPIKLADKDVNDYLEYMAYCQKNVANDPKKPIWEDYPDNPLTSDRVKEESENLKRNFRIVDYTLKYTDQFYNSMFYKCYIGYNYKDIGFQQEDQGVPSMFGNIASYPALQGWNMTHFKVVYRTMYYSAKDEANASFPEDYDAMNYDEALLKIQSGNGDVKSGLGQGVFILKYYDGAMLNGTLRLENGTPIARARITVQDEYGIPHGVFITDDNGKYSVILPPGESRIIVGKNELREGDSYVLDRIYQFQMDLTNYRPVDPYNVSLFQITDEQSMRKTSDWIINQDITVIPSSVRGRIYYDNNNNGQFDSDVDQYVNNAYLRLEQTNGNLIYKNVANYAGQQSGLYYDNSLEPATKSNEAISDGEIFFNDLIPGEYTPLLYIDGHKIEVPNTFTILPGDNLAGKDIPVSVSNITGYIYNPDGSNNTGIQVDLFDETSNTMSNVTVHNGYYSFEGLLPGNYTMSIDQAGYYPGTRHITLGSGDSNNSAFQLIPTAVVKGKVSSLGQMVPGQGLNNIYVEFNNLEDDTLSRQTTTDENGSYTIDLPKGAYIIYANYLDGESAYVSIGAVTVDSLDTIYTRDLAFKNAILVYGNATKLMDSPIPYAGLILTSKSGAQVMTLTNNSGNYRVYLPYDTYEIYTYHVSEPGNNTFSNQTYIDLSDTSITKKRVDLHVEFSLPVAGTLYWDMDGNGRYTQASDISLPFGTRLDVGLGDLIDSTSSLDTTNELEEGQAGVELTFKSSHYDLKTMTDSKGGFSIALPPDDYKVYTNDARYDTVSYTLDIPSEPTNDVFTDQSYSIVPKRVDLNLDYYSDANGNGKMELGEGAIDVPLTLTPAVVDLGVVSDKTDYNGNVELQLYPVPYRMKMNYTTHEMGTLVDYGLDKTLDLSVGQDPAHVAVVIGKKIGLSGTLEYTDNYGVPHPASNVTVEVIPTKAASSTTGKYYSFTDKSGDFNVSVYEGDYTVYATTTIDGKDYVYQKRFLATPGVSLGKMQLQLSVNETGLVTDQDSTTIDNLPISITNIATNATINVTTKDGRYSAQLLPDTLYRFFVDHHVVVDDKDIWHRFDQTIVVSQMNKTFDLKVLKLFNVAFETYYDGDFDNTKDAEEVTGGILIWLDSTDQKVPDQYKHLTITSDATAGVKIYLPYGRYTASAMSDVYSQTVTTSTSLDINYNMQTAVDIKLVAKGVAVTGMTITNLSGVLSKVPSTIIRFIPKTGTQVASEVTVASGTNSKYSAALYPVEYYVYAYNSGYAGKVYAYLGTTTINIGKPVTLDIVLSVGDDVSGAVFFYNTTNSLTMSINKERGLKFTYNGGTLYANIKEGSYQAYLPTGFIQVTGDYKTTEFGRDMTYTISTSLNVTPDKTDLSAYSLRLVKTEDHTLAFTFLYDEDFSITMNANETKHYQLKLTNLGNSRSDVTFSTNNVPSGWKVEIPTTAISVGIDQERIVLVNVTTSQTPLAINLIDVVAKSKQGSGSATAKLGINTPKLFRFKMNILGDLDNGVYLSSTTEYNISLKNDGNAGDKILLMFKRTPATKWNVTIQNEPIGYNGYNISMSEFEYRNLSLKIKAPNSTLAKTGDKFTLEVTATSMFYPELEPQKQTITLQIRRPNIYFKDVTFENANLKKDKYEFGVNVTVGSYGIETAPSNEKPLLKVYYKDKLLTTQTVSIVPEDGVAYMNFKINASKEDMVNETVKLKFVLDDNNSIPETNENDNELMKTFVVGKKSKSEFPYLVVTFGVIIVALVALGFVWWRRRAVYM